MATKIFNQDKTKIVRMKFISHYFVSLLAFVLCCISYQAVADNATYITLSNQIARKSQLSLVANNVANSNTIGYEADSVLFKNIDVKQTSKRSNSFTSIAGMYKREGSGNLKVTNRTLDLAIGGPGYFKILTPKGERYSLNGTILVNSENVLVNVDGFPIASRDSQAIFLPIDFQKLDITQDGTIYVDDIILDVVGVFDFNDSNKLVKEGNNLYSSQTRDILLDEYTIISGALRESNVNSAKAMTDMVELQRSVGMTDNLLSELAGMERSFITKIAK